MVTRAVTRVVTHSSYGKALHYGLSMFIEFEKLPYSSVISISVRLNLLPNKLYKHGQAMMQHDTTRVTVHFLSVQHVLGLFATSFHVLPSNLLNIYILIFFEKKFDGNAWQRVANSAKPDKYQRKCTVTRVVMCPSYCNTLHYGLSMFAEFEKLPYLSVISILVRCSRSSHLLLLEFIK